MDGTGGTTPGDGTDRIAEVRAFNRFYTKVIGVVQAELLHTPYSLTEGRVIYELGRRDSTEAGELRRELDLDAGYLSRMLARFEGDGLIARERSAEDARRQVVRLTEAGREARRTLDARSAELVGKLLAGVGEEDRRRLLGAMATIRDVLDPGARERGGYVIRPPRSGDFGWVVHRHGVLYRQEYGWGAEHEGLCAQIMADYVAGHDPERTAMWIAEVGGEPAGSIMCARRDDETAQLRLFLVEPWARGMGLGTRLVDECLRFARGAGYRRIMLWTYAALADARRVYQRAGFELESQEDAVAYGQDLVSQIWSRGL
jgi:DNA-binding MarR family transcriptional regulator/GNAT superfamily N-acetyltransferase